MATTTIELKQFESSLTTFKNLATSIVVNSPETCLTAKVAQRDLRNLVKDIHSKLDPFVSNAKLAYDKAREERDQWLTPAETLDEQLGQKVKDWERTERLKAEAETKRINEERRKDAEKKAEEDLKAAEAAAEEERKRLVKEAEQARKAGDITKREAAKLEKQAGIDAKNKKIAAQYNAEIAVATVQDLTVKPSIPTVAGVPSRVNYYAEVKNADALLIEWASATFLQRSYLRQFITIDEKALNAEARRIKDPKKLEQMIPGIRAWEE